MLVASGIISLAVYKFGPVLKHSARIKLSRGYILLGTR